tara:strand:+ start:9568 stop:12930 length:3363 start_codon:yes stop_codon:yes gene_type:complete
MYYSTWKIHYKYPSLGVVFSLTALLGLLTGPLIAQNDPRGLELFETEIRPILVEKCYVCHGPSDDPMGGLRVDSRKSLLKGGSRGTAIVPGNPDKSLLISAIRYDDLNLKMPPTGKLTVGEIKHFETWVSMGAPDPRVDQIPLVSTQETMNLETGKKFWAFQPLNRNALPEKRVTVANKQWATAPIDYFILAKLEENDLSPASPADKITLLRRATFGLLGLPPTRNDVNRFLSDKSPKAFENLIDDLLASPHYGERWGRHWLDLVRFAETNGHEFDNDKLDAWRYRDYIIRALNDDIPYNQLVKEHIAGDLVNSKRVSNDGTHWESPLGTGFYWFGEVLNAPTDSVKAKADRVDNQIDVLGKAFLGLTIACARCHDHKFDPIPTADYYSLAGILHSTTIREALINSNNRDEEISALQHEIGEINSSIRALTIQVPHTPVEEWSSYLRAAITLMAIDEPEFDCQLDELAAQNKLNRSTLKAWVTLLQQAGANRGHPFYPLTKLVVIANKGPDERILSFADKLNVVRQELSITKEKKPLNAREDIIFEDFNGTSYGSWTIEGLAFGQAPSSQTPPNQALTNVTGQTIANSFGAGSHKFVGSLTTAKFRMPRLYVHIRMAGTPESKPYPINPDVRVTIDSNGHKTHLYTLTRPNIWQWITRRMTKEIGRTCYIEIVDRSTTGHIAVDKIVFSDSEDPPWPLLDDRVVDLVTNENVTSLDTLLKNYAQLYIRLSQTSRPEDIRLFAELNPPLSMENHGLARLPIKQLEELSELQEQRRLREVRIPESLFGMVSKDENPQDIFIHQRGNHKNLGVQVPRQFLQVIAGKHQQPYIEGSGRLQLAEAMMSSSNPLAARVIVNRIWKHHFGSGIVSTVDNFGQTGKRPTHPKLLDYLASYLIDNNWSLKKIHRLLLLSSTYRTSSHPSGRSKEIDPQNRWLQHTNVKRLEAEVIRDTVLTVSGSLNRTLGGPGIAPFITQYQHGRGKPKSGPLNGNGRRSIYLQVRRNFIPPMFLAFDYPLPISTIGRRSISTVPSQALMMMNNEFIGREAELWASRLIEQKGTPRERIRTMFQTAFGRSPDESEMRYARSFLDNQKNEYAVFHENDPRIWADLAHVLFNSTEFIFVQ